MTIYYVRKSGNDSNPGTGTSSAWLTINRALSASGTASGDTLYIGSGVYREQVSVAMISATAETFVIGDVTGVYTGDEPGEIRITNYMTNDTTAPTDGNLLSLNARDFLTFSNIVFQSTILSSVNLAVVYMIVGSLNITFRDCTFFLSELSGNSSCWVIKATTPADTDSNLLIDRCIFYTTGCSEAINIVTTSSASAHYDAGIDINNCVFIGDTLSAAILVNGSGFAFFGGGAKIRNCSIFYSGIGVSASSIPTGTPVEVYNCMVLHAGFQPALQAQSSGMLVENYNLLYSFTPHSNVTPGANSIYDGSYAPLFHTGQESQWGATIRPFGMPSPNSPWLGFGNHSSAPDVDMLNRPRPASLASGTYSMNAVGAYERHDTGIEDSNVFDSAPASMKIVGAGDHDFEIPVNPISTNVTIMVRYDTNHGEANKPQVQILENPSIGVSAETLTMTDGIDTWEMLSFSNFTPTDYGIIILRCLSRSATSNGIAYFDSITV